jgi:K+-transporting ATPase ATPase C chain
MRSDLVCALRPALVLTLLFALLLGLAYPLALTGVGQVLFSDQANGSLIRGPLGEARGSRLIGQAFASPGYFHGRPSAAGEGYDALASSGSNLGPTSRELVDRVREDQRAIGGDAPPDLLLASGSGLDPHISPAAARFQVSRIAAARGAAPAVVQRLVDELTLQPLFGLLGEPRVNVTEINLALDRQLPER